MTKENKFKKWILVKFIYNNEWIKKISFFFFFTQVIKIINKIKHYLKKYKYFYKIFIS